MSEQNNVSTADQGVTLVIINAQGHVEQIAPHQTIPDGAFLLGYLTPSGQLVTLGHSFADQASLINALFEPDLPNQNATLSNVQEEVQEQAEDPLQTQAQDSDSTRDQDLLAINQFIEQGGSIEAISTLQAQPDNPSSSIAITGTIDATREEKLPASHFETEGRQLLFEELEEHRHTDASAPPLLISNNEPPTASREQRTYFEESADNPLNITLPSDPNGDPLRILVTELPTLGQVTLADGTPVTLNQTLTLEQLENLIYQAPDDYEVGDDAGYFVYSVTDVNGSGFSTEGRVEIMLEPINDVPVFTGEDEGDVYEDATDPNLTYSSQLVVMDADLNESKIKPGEGQPQGDVLGSLTINSDGVWTYTVDNSQVQYLGEGETREEIFHVESEDGTFHPITVTIHGINDPSVQDCDCQSEPGLVIEGSADVLRESGQLTITDPDGADEALFVPNTVQADIGTFGMLTITPEGVWQYQVDNQLVSYLDQGDVKEERFTVESVDGTQHEVVVVILGTSLPQDDLSDLLDGIGDELGQNEDFMGFDQEELDFLSQHVDHIGDQEDHDDPTSESGDPSGLFPFINPGVEAVTTSNLNDEILLPSQIIREQDLLSSEEQNLLDEVFSSTTAEIALGTTFDAESDVTTSAEPTPYLNANNLNADTLSALTSADLTQLTQDENVQSVLRASFE